MIKRRFSKDVENKLLFALVFLVATILFPVVFALNKLGAFDAKNNGFNCKCGIKSEVKQ